MTTFEDNLDALVGRKVKVESPSGSLKTGILGVWDKKHQSLSLFEKDCKLPTIIRGTGWNSITPTEE